MKTGLFLLCFALLQLSACQTTEVLNTWSDDPQTQTFSKVLVIAVLKERVYRTCLNKNWSLHCRRMVSMQKPPATCFRMPMSWMKQ